MSSILQFANPFHAYVFGTSFWYFLRGIVRVIDPATVCGWFRPPVDRSIFTEPNDLELYTTRTDAFCLLALSAILLTVSDAIPLPTGYTGSQLASSTTSTATKRPYARAVIAITMLHHVATGLGAATHWWYDSHNTVAMEIGVYGNVGLVVLGVAALMVEETRGGVVGGKKRA